MTEPTAQAIQDLLDAVSDRLEPRRRDDVSDYLSHREWGLAAELIADGLSETDSKLSNDEKVSLRAILTAMDIPVSDYDFVLA